MMRIYDVDWMLGLLFNSMRYACTRGGNDADFITKNASWTN